MSLRLFAARVLLPPIAAGCLTFAAFGLHHPGALHATYVDGAPVVHVDQERIGLAP